MTDPQSIEATAIAKSLGIVGFPAFFGIFILSSSAILQSDRFITEVMLVFKGHFDHETFVTDDAVAHFPQFTSIFDCLVNPSSVLGTSATSSAKS
jgi:hypothetical protein